MNGIRTYLSKDEIYLHIRSLTTEYDEIISIIWTKYSEHDMIIIDQIVNTNDQRRNQSLQTGI